MAYFSFASPLTLPQKTKLAVTTIKLGKEKPPQNVQPSVVTEKKENKTTPPIEKKESPPSQAKPSPRPPPTKQPVVHPKKERSQKPKTETKPSTQKKQSNKKSNKPAKKPDAHTKKTNNIDKKVALKKELIAQAQASLNKVDSKAKSEPLPGLSSEPSSPIQSFSATISCQSEEVSSVELSYREELANRLKLLLRLPEMGEINVKLTIQKNGTIKHLEILSSESLLNRKYVEKTLLQHTMPSLGKQFGHVEDYTFTITMRGS
ncbi:MAG: hypothetical protein ACSNEK_04525 [Parachlamydiaceae bacterium]